jgi:hypothetical protein
VRAGVGYVGMLDDSEAEPLVDEGTGESLFESSTPTPLDPLAPLG